MTQLIEATALFAVNPELAKSAVGLIDKLLGKPCEVAGAMIADQLYFWQWKNRIKIAEKAQKILKQKEIAAKVLPAGFLVPLLDAAGNVEDETLQDMWASLLVSGVENDQHQHPAFVSILRDCFKMDANGKHRYSSGGLTTFHGWSHSDAVFGVSQQSF